MKTRKLVLGTLILLNAIVLLGQLWPAAVPPFARNVNIIFLICSIVFFTYSIAGKK